MKKFLTYFIKFSAAFVLTIFVLEIVVNLSEIGLPSRVYDDPKFGRSHRPNAKIMEISSEGYSMGTVNRYGYLGPAYPPERSPKSIRIALIGDSYVAGLQLFDRHHFRHHLETELSFLTQKKVEVLNFGIGGIDLRGMYLLYKEKVINYQPDIVLFFIKKEDLLNKDHLPVPDLYLVNNTINVSYEFLNSEEYKLRKRFAFVRKIGIGSLLKESYKYYRMGKTGEILFEKFYPAESPNPERPASVSVMQKSDDKFYEINKAIFQQIGAGHNPSRIKNVVVETSAYPDYYNEDIRNFDLIVFDLNKELSAQENKGKNLTYWKISKKTGHWNHQGHHVVATFLAGEVYNLYKNVLIDGKNHQLDQSTNKKIP